jgi:hypothetical protein
LTSDIKINRLLLTQEKSKRRVEAEESFKQNQIYWETNSETVFHKIKLLVIGTQTNKKNVQLNFSTNKMSNVFKMIRTLATITFKPL